MLTNSAKEDKGSANCKTELPEVGDVIFQTSDRRLGLILMA